MPELKKYQKYMAGFSKTQWFIMILLAVSLLYISKGTAPVPNFYNGTVLYDKDSMVPEDYFSNNELAFVYALIIWLILTFVGKEAKKAERIDIREAIEIMDNYLKKRKSIRTETGLLIELGDYHIDTNFLTRDIMTKGEIKTHQYVLQITIKSADRPPLYVKGYVGAYSRFIDGFVEMDGPLEPKDKCSQCGSDFDFKMIDTEEYKTFKRIKGEMKD